MKARARRFQDQKRTTLAKVTFTFAVSESQVGLIYGGPEEQIIPTNHSTLKHFKDHY